MVAHRLHVAKERTGREHRALNALDDRLGEIAEARVELGGNLGSLDREPIQVGLEHVDDAVGVLEQGHDVCPKIGDEGAGEELGLDRTPQRILPALDLACLVEKVVVRPVHPLREVDPDRLPKHEGCFGDLVEEFVDLVFERARPPEEVRELPNKQHFLWYRSQLTLVALESWHHVCLQFQDFQVLASW